MQLKEHGNELFIQAHAKRRAHAYDALQRAETEYQRALCLLCDPDTLPPDNLLPIMALPHTPALLDAPCAKKDDKGKKKKTHHKKKNGKAKKEGQSDTKAVEEKEKKEDMGHHEANDEEAQEGRLHDGADVAKGEKKQEKHNKKNAKQEGQCDTIAEEKEKETEKRDERAAEEKKDSGNDAHFVSEATTLCVQLFSNLAATLLAMDRPLRAAAYARCALALDPAHAKAR